jgi:hypothetical protein
MDKRKFHHLLTKIVRIKPRYFLIIFILSGLVCIFALRSNNQTMLKLRYNVYQADQQNGNVEAALQQLRAYVYDHMNTNLASGPNPVYPPIQLKYTYQRLQQAAQSQADAINAQIYTDAQNYCQQQNSASFSGRTRVPCIEAYVQSHGVQPTQVPTALYEYDFESPAWSPDLAGWTLVLSVVALILFIVSYVLQRWSKKTA